MLTKIILGFAEFYIDCVVKALFSVRYNWPLVNIPNSQTLCLMTRIIWLCLELYDYELLNLYSYNSRLLLFKLPLLFCYVCSFSQLAGTSCILPIKGKFLNIYMLWKKNKIKKFLVSNQRLLAWILNLLHLYICKC